ncbi:MAG: exodeoxyribonuclease III [Steroidobacteraceae bacterium]
MRTIATWNVNSLRVRLPQLTEWLASRPVHTLALQETKLEDGAFPRAELEALGYQVACNGQRTYNGVAILARAPLHDIVTDIGGFEDPQRRVLAATIDGVRVVNLYVPNGQAVGSDKYAYKLRWLEALRGWLAQELARHSQLIVLGDFNIAPEDRDVHDPARWEGSVHVSAPERAALAALTALGLEDSFRLFEQPKDSFSWWDYRQGAFRRNHGLRIDLLLVSAALAARCRESAIDREPRRAERPSDHAPAYASFDI